VGGPLAHYVMRTLIVSGLPAWRRIRALQIDRNKMHFAEPLKQVAKTAK
jgi:hypothetical protein